MVEEVIEVLEVHQEVEREVEKVTEDCQTPEEEDIIQDHIRLNKVTLTHMEVIPLTITRRIILHTMQVLIIRTTGTISSGQFWRRN